MNIKAMAVAAVGPLIFLALLMIRPLRRKQAVAEEVSALRHLGNAKRGASPDKP
jgi:hypothetical protein